MKLNRRMERYLADLRSREVEADFPLPGRGPDVQIVEAGRFFLLRGFLHRPPFLPADFPDPTRLESNPNKLLMEAMFDSRLIASFPPPLLTPRPVTTPA